jgi:hypothetical protein
VAYERLAGDLAFISLGGVKDRAELDEVFESLRSSKGLIFDIREPNPIDLEIRAWWIDPYCLQIV